jgi:tripeptide aminopeptidase
VSERLFETFTCLCEIPSETGRERRVADWIAGRLRGFGFEVSEDDSAERAGANAGNLICRVPGRSDAWVSLFAHMDTVPHSEPIEVVFTDGVFRSAGETILGADNKAAVAVLIELAARATSRPPACGLELVFTVAEEEGLRGARELDVSALRSPFGYVFDHATPIGEIITAAPTYNRVVAGVEAHSGIRPEEGRSAIQAAATAIERMELGRLDDETTANVGMIEGGTASNVVAGHCRLVCEARSLDEEKVARATASIVDACTFAATEGGCDVDIDVWEVFRRYRISSSARSLRIAREALAACGHEPREVATGGGSDANALILQGYEALLLANGTEANHTHHESVAAARLVEHVALCEALAERVAAGAGAAPPAPAAGPQQ